MKMYSIVNGKKVEEPIGFEAFLQEKHAEDYIGLDDYMSESFDSWVTDLSVEEFCTLADEYKTT